MISYVRRGQPLKAPGFIKISACSAGHLFKGEVVGGLERLVGRGWGGGGESLMSHCITQSFLSLLFPNVLKSKFPGFAISLIEVFTARVLDLIPRKVHFYTNVNELKCAFLDLGVKRSVPKWSVSTSPTNAFPADVSVTF